MTTPLPKTIWLYWAQGWNKAPSVVEATRRTWEKLHPDWDVRALDNTMLEDVLPSRLCEWVPEAITKIPGPSRSDRIRLALLYHHGGVWADATAAPTLRLDDWLLDQMDYGFFGFKDPPKPGRPIASWFLASEPGGRIVGEWLRRTDEYWQGRDEFHMYHWVHELFIEMLAADSEVAEMWSKVPRIGATHPLHFGPLDSDLALPPSAALIEALSKPVSPIMKLTYKVKGAAEAKDSALNHIIQWCDALENPPKTWQV